MKYCMKCGKKMQDDDAFCSNCGFGSRADIDPFGYDTPTKIKADDVADDEDDEQTPETVESAQPTSSTPVQNKYNKSIAQSVKSVMTGSKRGLLCSIVVLVLSVVMLFTAIFAPVKVADYSQIVEGSITIDHVSNDGLKVSFGEIEQSVFQIIDAFNYIKPSAKQKNKIEKQMETAQDEAALDLGMWMLTHSDATEFELGKKQSEIYVKHLSDVNYFAYCLCKADESGLNSARFKILIFLAITALVVLLLLATAIASLVYIIKCIVGLARRRPDINVNKFLKIMLAMTGAALLTAMLSPVTMSSGSPFGLFVFVAILMVLWGTLTALCDGQKPLTVLKRVLTAALTFTTFVLICCNCVKIVAVYDYKYVVLCKPGMGLASIVASLPKPMGMGLAIAILYILLAVCGGITAYLAAAGALKSAVDHDDKSTKIGVRTIVLAVFTVAAIVIGFSADTIAEAFDKILENSATGVLVEINISIAGTVWAAAVLSVITAIFAFVFKPNARPQISDTDGATQSDETQPVEGEQYVEDERSVSAEAEQTAAPTENV